MPTTQKSLNVKWFIIQTVGLSVRGKADYVKSRPLNQYDAITRFIISQSRHTRKN